MDYSDAEPDDQWPASDDDYCYNVTHFDISDARIRQVTRGRDVCRGTCTVRLDKPAGDFVFVLIGYQLQFYGDDNHIKEIKMLENNGDFTVAYRDQELNDPTDTFIWDLQYAYVPRDRFIQIGDRRDVLPPYFPPFPHFGLIGKLIEARFLAEN